MHCLKTFVSATLIASLATASWADSLMKESTPLPRTANGALGRALLHTVVPIGAGALAAAVAPEAGGGIIGGGAMVYGVFIGPSMGNFYLGDSHGGTLGIVSRGIGSGIMVLGFGMALGCALNSWGDDHGASRCNETTPLVLFVGGGATFLGGTLWNLSRLSKAARLREAEYSLARHQPVVRLAATPTWNRVNNAMGMQVAISY